MTNHDALAREMWLADWDCPPSHSWEQEHDKGRGIYLNLADIAMRHIEEARADGFREGLDRALSAIDSERLAEPIEETDAAYERALDDAGEAIHAIRAGSPAPAAPVVWTDAQAKAALREFYKWDAIIADFGQDIVASMRAALEAASREGK